MSNRIEKNNSFMRALLSNRVENRYLDRGLFFKDVRLIVVQGCFSLTKS